ncbi:MAG TPA: signal peptidase I, partial [Planctomycetaceae bacterium]|jgi:signal peptidase I
VAGLASSTGALVGLFASFVTLLGLWLFAVVDAWRITARTTENAGEVYGGHDYQRPLIYALFVAAGISAPMLCVAYIRQNLLEAFYLPSESMTPLLHRGDRILVNKARWRVQNLKRWDVIVFRAPDHPERTYIKRLVGLPGEQVLIEGDEVKVNGQPADIPDGKPPAGDQPKREMEEHGREQVIPPGMCYVLGDNRKNSNDSRSFGPVALGNILGVAEYIYLPGDEWSRFGALR